MDDFSQQQRRPRSARRGKPRPHALDVARQAISNNRRLTKIGTHWATGDFSRRFDHRTVNALIATGAAIRRGDVVEAAR